MRITDCGCVYKSIGMNFSIYDYYNYEDSVIYPSDYRDMYHLPMGVGGEPNNGREGIGNRLTMVSSVAPLFILIAVVLAALYYKKPVQCTYSSGLDAKSTTTV